MSAAKRGVSGPYSILKAAYRSIRHMPDRVLHRRRHREAREQLLRLGPVSSVLVVCHGNICRSPYLEAVLRRALPHVSVISAGLIGPGRPVPRNSLILSAERGLDLSTFCSRPVSRVNAREVDLVVVMDSEQAGHLARVFGVSPRRIIVAGDLDPRDSATRAIRDPWQQSLDVFRTSFDRLDRCAATIARLILQSQQTSSEPVNPNLAPRGRRRSRL